MDKSDTETAIKLLEDILTEEQIRMAITKSLNGNTNWQLLGSVVKPASENITGYLGNHLKAQLQLKLQDEVKTVYIFIKSMPKENNSLVAFLKESNYYEREMVVSKLLEEMEADKDAKPFCPKILVYSETVMVMSDLSAEGYSMRPQTDPFDLPHMLLTTAAVARYHAAIANYETKRGLDREHPYRILEEYGDVIVEWNFQYSPWLRGVVKVAHKFIRAYFDSCKTIVNLEEKLLKLFIEACDTLKEYEGTLNVLVHKDLWVNNVMFKYDGDVPRDALLLDFQCVRYAPPAYDLMFTLYLNTSRRFRDLHERELLKHYFETFYESVDAATARRLQGMNYDFEQFVEWCEKSRMFALTLSAGVLPYTTVEGAAVQEYITGPEEFVAYISEDLTDHKLNHSRRCAQYRNRILDTFGELVERYVSKW